MSTMTARVFPLNLLALFQLLLLCFGDPLLVGPYQVTRWNFQIDTLHPSDPSAEVVFPTQILSSDEDGQKFPLLVFSHGLLAGGNSIFLQTPLLELVASHGYIVTAHRSCNTGCDRYYLESLKMIQWSQEMEENQVMKFVDHDVGYGLYGYSMGGRGTAEALRYSEDFNIKAGLLLHPGTYEESDPLDISVPFAAFTGSDDACCGDDNTLLYYEPVPPPKVYASIRGAGHMEPVLRFRWQPFIAAWFKVFLENDGEYYYDLIFGNSTDSLCRPDGFLPLNACEIQMPHLDSPTYIQWP